MKKLYYTKEELALANNGDILACLKQMGLQFKQEGHFYRSLLHDSLIIRDNGFWAWNSRDIKGKAPVELLKYVLMEIYSYNRPVLKPCKTIKISIK